MAYLLAILVLLGGLASLHNNGDLAAMSDDYWQQSKAASSIAQDNAKFSWDMVRYSCRLVQTVQLYSTESYYSFRLPKNLAGTNVFQDVNAPVL